MRQQCRRQEFRNSVRTNSKVPLFLLFLLTTFGCESPSVAPEDVEGSLDDPEFEEVPLESKRAYHILQHGDLTDPTWPGEFRNYRVFMCNPSFEARHIDQIHADIPRSLCFAAVSAQDAALGLFPDNPYWEAFEAAFDTSLCIRNLATGNVVRLYGYDPDNPDAEAYPAFVMRRRSADALAAFHRDVTMQAGWDGLYIDMFTARWQPWKKALLESVAPSYDIDDDGLADNRTKIDQLYTTWLPYFTQRLRNMLGRDVILIGNTDGLVNNRQLNGISLENVGPRHSINAARWYIMSQLVMSDRPLFSIVWAIREESERPSLQLAQELDWVYLGTAQ
jgi:hypothetical protein